MNLNNLTRKELAESIAERLGFSQSSCAEIVDNFLDAMKQELLAGGSIKLVHFGTFCLRDKSPRNGRNPRTGDAITIRPRQTVSFRPSKQLRVAINR
jgi:integration host factor subunit alpha